MTDTAGSDESLFPIAVLIDELRHEDVQVIKVLIELNSNKIILSENRQQKDEKNIVIKFN
jgi:hypothetical protein